MLTSSLHSNGEHNLYVNRLLQKKYKVTLVGKVLLAGGTGIRFMQKVVLELSFVWIP